jgi:hypothetical protein
MFQAPIQPPLATGTMIVVGVPGTTTYVTAVAFVTGAGSVVTWIQGDGAQCGTNTVGVTGAMTFTASTVFTAGDGNGAIWVLGPGKSLCVTTATAVISGYIAWARF